MKKSLLLTLTLVLSGQIFAQNPIISTVFTPDPAPFVYGDKVYLFTDHDVLVLSYLLHKKSIKLQ